MARRLAILLWIALPVLPFGCGGPSGSTGQQRLPTTLVGETLTSDPRSLTPALLTPSSKTIDLGIVPQAGREQETFALVNPGTEPVEISKFETSCECLEIDLLRREIGPSEKVLARAMLDLGKEPQFLGNLGIEVKGLTGAGKTAFSIVVQVSVRSPDEFETKEDAL